jgi:hypothetical protein
VQCHVIHAARRHRITHHFPKRADRQVWFLRQKENVAVARSADLAASKRPDPGKGAEERTFSRTRSSPQQNGVSAQKREIHIGDKRLTIGEIEIHTLSCQMRDIAVGAPDSAAGRRLDAHTL